MMFDLPEVGSWFEIDPKDCNLAWPSNGSIVRDEQIYARDACKSLGVWRKDDSSFNNFIFEIGFFLEIEYF